jgi:hypothetical protein
VAEYRAEQLQGRWVHSHEEDTDEEMVFRPEGYAFPRSRGRTAFELHPDGTYVESSPGPVDVPVESTGSWTLAGDRLVLGTDRAWRITGAAGDRLTVRK